MTAVDEMDRLDGIIHCTPQAVGELVNEVRRLRAALAGVIEATDLDEVGVIARRALEPQP